MFVFVNFNTGSPRLATGGSSAKVTVGSNRYLNGQISVLSFPQPNSSLIFPSGAPNSPITLRIDATETNLFTITITKTNLQLGDFRTYVLNVANQYGRETIYVSIIPRGMYYIWTSTFRHILHQTWQKWISLYIHIIWYFLFRELHVSIIKRGTELKVKT